MSLHYVISATHLKTVQLRFLVFVEEIRGKKKDFNCFLNVNACPLSLDSRRSCSGIEFQYAGPVTGKSRRCVSAEGHLQERTG